MNSIFKTATTMAGVVVLGTLFTGRASAGCGSVDGAFPPAVAAFFSSEMKSAAKAVPMSRTGVNTTGIVGLWKVTLVSKGSTGIPDGTVIDAGYSTWHSDGTELLNSGRPPLTGNFCMGVWAQTGDWTYSLNHYALNWDATGSSLLGPTNIRENVTLDYSATAFTGTFTIVNYDLHGNTTATVVGTITGTRVTVDTP